MKHSTHTISYCLIVIASFLLLLGAQGSVAAAHAGVVTLSFDDGNHSQYETIVPILKANNQTGVFFINSGFVGTDTYMTWDDVTALHQSGFEIGAHTTHHVELPAVNQQVAHTEVNQDYANFVARGITPTSFASPFGAYDNTVLSIIGKRYNSHRAFANQGLNAWPYNKYLLYVHYITNQTSVEQARVWVDEAMATDSWLVLVFHEIVPTVDPHPVDEYSWETAQFQAFISYLNAKHIQTKTIQETLSPYTNLISNPSFESGLTGWSTDNARAGSGRGSTTRPSIALDTNNNGSYPSPKNSIRMTGTTKGGHLFGQKVPITHDTVYGFRAYTDSRLLRAGEVGFYIDEYDQNGAWISGKWLGSFTNKNVIDKSYVYKPTAAAVKTAAVQVYITQGATGSVFIDNIELFAR